jgi:hypothetical protein
MKQRLRAFRALGFGFALGCAPVAPTSTLPEPTPQPVITEFDAKIVIVVDATPPRTARYVPVRGETCGPEILCLPPKCMPVRPIQFRTTVGNSLRDAVEASTY